MKVTSIDIGERENILVTVSSIFEKFRAPSQVEFLMNHTVHVSILLGLHCWLNLYSSLSTSSVVKFDKLKRIQEYFPD